MTILGSEISTLVRFEEEVDPGVVRSGVRSFISPPRAWNTGMHCPKSLESISFLSIAMRANMTRALRGREGATEEEGWFAMASYTTASSQRTVARLNRDREWPVEILRREVM